MIEQQKLNRRQWFQALSAPAAAIALDAMFTCQRSNAAQAGPKDNVKVTNIETFVLTNTWVFVKISTNAGITGWGEMLKDDAKACAAGALEAVASLLALRAGFVPPTVTLENPDPECDLDYVPKRARAAELRSVLSNSYGFGGNNTSLVLRRVDD